MNKTQEAKRQQMVAFLRRRPDLVPQPIHPYMWRPNPLPSPEQYAQLVLADAEFRALQLGTWLGTTDGQIISQAVGEIMPPLFRPEYDLLVNGLTLAASLQAQDGQQVANRVAVGVLVGSLALAGLTMIARGAA
jgi:hypothetical protein